MKSGESRANANRRLRQENLREWLSEKCTAQHLVDNIKKIEDLGSSLEPHDLNRMKAANDARLKLLNKYLPDLKSVEVVDEDGNDALPKTITINVVNPS